MKKLLAIAVILVLVTVGVVIIFFSHRSAPGQVILSPSPSAITVDVNPAKEASLTLVPTWGTYSYADFPAYAERVKPYLTQDYTDTLFSPSAIASRQQELTRRHFVIKTTDPKVQETSVDGETVTVKLTANQKTHSDLGDLTDVVTYSIKWQPVNGRWKASDVYIEGQNG